MRLTILLSTFIYIFVNTTFAQTNQSLPPVETMVENILGHEGHGHYHFHTTPMLCDVKVVKNHLNIYLETSASSVQNDLYDHLLESLLPIVAEYQLDDFSVFIKTKRQEVYQDLSTLITSTPIPAYKVPDNSDPFPNKTVNNQQRNNPHFSQNLATGSLSGKTVWLSQGHGWLADNANNNWLTQRGNTNDYVEDFGSVEGINYYLQQYLMNAGASVWTVRERDVQTNEIVVDNDSGLPAFTTTGTWPVSGSSGYNGGTYQFTTSGSTETQTAVYTPTIPESGWYWVSVYYRQGMNRSVDTQYKINHAGGQTIVSVNQEVHGLTWNYIGQFYFEAGTQGNVVLSNESSETGQAIIADAIRFGGGMGSTTDCTFGGSPSGEPRFEEAARQYAPFQGYPTCEGDVAIRPKYAEWELAKGTPTEQANAVYVSWHTNAFNGSARGTETYSFNGSGGIPITAGSADLSDFIQTELINDIQGDWDGNWQDRGTKIANFGELRELTTMPGCLVEIAFHDNPTDATALKTPFFRNLAARAMYQGIVKFFNNRDGSPIDLLPEPPTHLSAKNTNTGDIVLNWQAPINTSVAGDAATGYSVYISTHGKGFQNAIPVTGTSYTVTNLTPGVTYYFRVAATNAGGESFPTATVAARTPSVANNVVPTYLIVDGFDRIDLAGSVYQFESAALGNVDRMFLERMNSFDYMVEHAKGFDSCGIPFDGASNEAVLAGTVNLSDYDGVDWISGEESTVDRSLDLAEQTLLMNYLDNGGSLIISGAEIGWDIGRSSSPNASLSFYNNYLKATYSGDDSGTYNFSGVTGGDYDGINGSFDNGTSGYYDAEFPDRLTPFGGSNLVLNYTGGTNDGAAIAYKGNDFGVFYFGFPLETVTDEVVRNNLICEAISCITPNVCLFSESIMTNYASGDMNTIVTENNITASNTVISAGANIIYDAGVQICLDQGFEVELGAEFLGTISGCTNLTQQPVQK